MLARTRGVRGLIMTMRAGRLVALSFATAAAFSPVASARETDNARDEHLDTEHLFVFASGTDVDQVGDKEIELESEGRFGKRTGSYAALTHSLALQFVPLPDLRVELATATAGHAIHGVPDLDDRHRLAFDGLSLDLHYRLIDRKRAGFGLAIAAEPHWGIVDESSGERADRFGIDVALLADTELVPDRVAAAFNILYQPETQHSRVTGAWEHESTVGFAGALMAQVASGMFAGAEARYLRRYDGLGLDRFAGHALFLGPAIFARLSKEWTIAAGWAVQVAGRSVDEPGALDLAHFERHQVKLRLGVEF
jgi:hypothetical protein